MPHVVASIEHGFEHATIPHRRVEEEWDVEGSSEVDEKALGGDCRR